jgi:hypothetical protein
VGRSAAALERTTTVEGQLGRCRDREKKSGWHRLPSSPREGAGGGTTMAQRCSSERVAGLAGQ